MSVQFEVYYAEIFALNLVNKSCRSIPNSGIGMELVTKFQFHSNCGEWNWNGTAKVPVPFQFRNGTEKEWNFRSRFEKEWNYR